MWIQNTKRARDFAPGLRNGDTAFELYERIEPVALVYGGNRWFVSEQNSARRLLRELHRLGRDGVPLIAVISATAGALDASSLRALNCYLEHYYGKLSGRQLAGALHRFSWYELQRSLALRWIR